MIDHLPTYDAVRACAIAILGGRVLQSDNVSAGNGVVIDWREVKCGDSLLSGADAFDTAQLFVALVGPAAALAATADVGIAPAPPVPRQVPKVHAWAQGHDGGRRRSFAVGPFEVHVEPHADDAAQAAFTAALARVAADLA